jgi:hypothetical protein
MRPNGGGVQFFDLVEVDWRSDHGCAATAAASSGCTDGATGAMCTAVTGAAVRAGGGLPGWHDSDTGRAMRVGSTTATGSERAGSAGGPTTWGITVPRS